jgi:hypothetical protein
MKIMSKIVNESLQFNLDRFIVVYISVCIFLVIRLMTIVINVYINVYKALVSITNGVTVFNVVKIGTCM